MTSLRKPVIFQIYFCLATLEGIVAFYYAFQTQSMERNAWLFGFSLPRLLLGAALLGVISFLVWLSVKALSDRRWVEGAVSSLDLFVSSTWRWILSSLALGVVAIAGLGLLYVLSSDLFEDLPYVLRVTLERLYPLLVWATLVAVQSLAILYVSIPGAILHRFSVQPKVIAVLLFASLLAGAIFQFVFLSLRIAVFEEIPDWFWNFRERGVSFRHLVFLVIFILAIFVTRQVLRYPGRERWNVALILILGYAVQLSFGIAQGQGFESLRLKYLSSGLSVFSKNACSQVGVLESVRRYDELYGSGFWEGTKPPGLQSLFLLIGDGVELIHPGASQQACFEKLTTYAAYIFPLIAVLVLFPLIYVGKFLFNENQVAYLAAIFYLTLPNFTQFPLFHDQFLLPLVFMAALALILFAFRQSSFWLSTLTGVVLFLSVFISFSLLPLLGFALIWLVLAFLSSQDGGSWGDFLKVSLGLVLGLALTALIFYQFLDYDPIARYQAAFAQHRLIKYFKPVQGQFWLALLQNNLEYFILVGFPVAVLFLFQSFASLLKFAGGRQSRVDMFAVALFVTYLALNLLGQTKGEVARIWLFLSAAVCLVGAFGLLNTFRSRPFPVYLVVGAQWVISVLVFQFLDYGCKFCP